LIQVYWRKVREFEQVKWTGRRHQFGRLSLLVVATGIILSSIGFGAASSDGVSNSSSSPGAYSGGQMIAADPNGGYWTVTGTGVISSFEGAPSFGSPAQSGIHLAVPVVGMEATPDGGGYWVVASDGGIFSFGDAQFYGSTGAIHLNKPIVGMAATPDGKGYWLVATDGGIFSFGDAAFYGSTGAIHLNKPIVGMAATPDGRGYWMVASDGGIFSFGDASFHGSTGAIVLNKPIIGMAATPDGGGYWLVASDGGIFSFGGAGFYGSLGGRGVSATGIIVSPSTLGYTLVASNGSPTAFTSSLDTPPTTTPSPASPTTTPTTVAPSNSSAGSPTPKAAPTALADIDLPDSMFTKSVVNQPMVADSAAVVANLVSQVASYFGTVGVNEMPIFSVPANAAMVPISVLSGCNDFTASTGSEIPIPPDAYTTNPAYQDDSDMIITQPSTNSVWELWRAAKSSDGAWSACWGGKLNSATSTGVFPNNYGISASGISYAALTVTESDIASGSINHAIAIDVPECNAYVFPANRTDCSSSGVEPSEGTWFRLPSSIAMPTGMTPFAQMVFKALQTYGAVVTDHAGAVMVQAESIQDWATADGSGVDPITTSWAGEPEYFVLNGVPWSDLQVIEPQS
jgi:hypothetical protein